jgi:hypothetical protein
MILILLICIVPIILSIPAFIILRRKKRLLIVDLGLSIYATLYLFVLAHFTTPVFSGFGFANAGTEPIIVGLCTVIINYTKLIIPNRIPVKILSLGGIAILLIITTLIFFFFPPLSE